MHFAIIIKIDLMGTREKLEDGSLGEFKFLKYHESWTLAAV
jgi:hypothetical protein